MTIAQIDAALREIETSGKFEEWFSDSIIDLTTYFHNQTPKQLYESKFDSDFYFGVLVPSKIFQHFQDRKHKSEAFISFLELVAVAGERLAEKYGLTSVIDHVLPFLPESSVRYRLEALGIVSAIDNAREDYLERLPAILAILAKSETLDNESHTQRVVDFLIYYYDTAYKELNKRKYLTELDKFKLELQNAKKIEEYPFLGHPALQDALKAEAETAIYVQDTPVMILFPSDAIESLFKKEINSRVLSHKDSRGLTLLMGYDKSTILNDG